MGNVKIKLNSITSNEEIKVFFLKSLMGDFYIIQNQDMIKQMSLDSNIFLASADNYLNTMRSSSSEDEDISVSIIKYPKDNNINNLLDAFTSKLKDPNSYDQSNVAIYNFGTKYDNSKSFKNLIFSLTSFSKCFLGDASTEDDFSYLLDNILLTLINYEYVEVATTIKNAIISGDTSLVIDIIDEEEDIEKDLEDIKENNTVTTNQGVSTQSESTATNKLDIAPNYTAQINLQIMSWFNEKIEKKEIENVSVFLDSLLYLIKNGIVKEDSKTVSADSTNKETSIDTTEEIRDDKTEVEDAINEIEDTIENINKEKEELEMLPDVEEEVSTEDLKDKEPALKGELATERALELVKSINKRWYDIFPIIKNKVEHLLFFKENMDKFKINNTDEIPTVVSKVVGGVVNVEILAKELSHFNKEDMIWKVDAKHAIKRNQRRWRKEYNKFMQSLEDSIFKIVKPLLKTDEVLSVEDSDEGIVAVISSKDTLTKPQSIEEQVSTESLKDNKEVTPVEDIDTRETNIYNTMLSVEQLMEKYDSEEELFNSIFELEVENKEELLNKGLSYNLKTNEPLELTTKIKRRIKYQNYKMEEK